jgi:hypothetical protein
LTETRKPLPVGTVPLYHKCLDFRGTEQEHRFLSFFHHHTAPIISGCFDSEFWNKLLPQVGNSEPTIRHAMIAVAVAYARLESIDELLPGVDNAKESRYFELQQYNKAIHHLRLHLSANGVTLEVTLMCCLLLICLEFLRGNIEQAILHLQGGINILHNYHVKTKYSSIESSSPYLPARSSLIAQQVEDMFNRLRNQWILCGRATSLDDAGFIPDSLTSKSTFSSLGEARSSLDQLSTLCLQVIHASADYVFTSLGDGTGSMDTTISARHGWISAQLGMWAHAFESFTAQNTCRTDTQFIYGSTLLRMSYITFKIWLAACISTEETIFDEKTQEFAAIIALASTLMKSSYSYISLPQRLSARDPVSFTFEMGVIAPLYFVALKCRDGQLRRKAISLLSICTPRREGFWDADILTYVARRAVELEETGLEEFVTYSSGKAAARTIYRPPEHDRFVAVLIRHEHDWQNQVQKPFSIICIRKPVQGSNDWIFHQEDIVLESGSAYKPVRESSITRKAQVSTWASAAFEIRLRHNV